MRSPRTRLTAAMLCLVIVQAAFGCGNESEQPALALDEGVGLPTRTQAPDLSRVTPEFRANGGEAFVRLTGFPTSRAIQVLKESGLSNPPGRADLVTFDSLRIASVWGYVGSGRVDDIAGLTFVTAITPTADRIGH